MTRMKRSMCAALEAKLEGRAAHIVAGGAILWDAFLALSRARSCGPVGPNPIAYSEISAWTHLMRMPLEPHHVEVLTAMDNVWIDHVYRGSSSPDGVKRLPKNSGQKLTPEMFDLVL